MERGSRKLDLIQVRSKSLEGLPQVTSGKGMEFLVTVAGFVFGGLGEET